MQKKHIIIMSSIIGAICIVGIFLICFFSIPRITYGYDHEARTYYVDKVYGNAKRYTIKDSIKDKPVTKIRSRAFMNKSNLKEIILSENLEEIERLAFLNCKRLEKIDLSHVKVIGRNAFENCTSLRSVELTLEDILGGTFIGCTGLETVTLTNTLTIGTYAFAYTNIEEVTIPRNCYLIGVDAFYGCDSLRKVIVQSQRLSNDSYLNSLNGVEFQFNESKE
ncbi:MAG: leucine-rich repeat domain-containing protein [Anaeroplasmataceae bacterium]|nr:leucine-rich repeat domain-containing protein [Anaeroplasmataceae bacterium]